MTKILRGLRGATTAAANTSEAILEASESVGNGDMAGDIVMSKILLRRFGTPEDVACAVWFLASAYANYVTGEVLHVDGGFKME